MSRVSNQLLTMSSLEDEETRVREVNEAIAEAFPSKYAQEFVSMNDNWNGYGGYKAFEATLYVAAFNHMNGEQIFECLQKASWHYPEDVQLIYKDEDQEGFKVLALPVRDYA